MASKTSLAGTVVDGLILKDLSLDQAQRFFEHVQENRDIYSETIPFVSKTHTLADMQASIRRNLQRQADGISEFYTLWDGEHLAGFFLIREWEREAGWAEIGYMIGTEWQRRGLTRKICVLLINEIFMDPGMQKVVICCNDDNAASIAVARSLGFTLEGTLRRHYVVNGKLRNMCYFGLLKEEWGDSLPLTS